MQQIRFYSREESTLPKTLPRTFGPKARFRNPLTLPRVKKYGLNMMVSLDDQVKAYVKKIMSQLNKWIQKSKISKLVIVVTSKETGDHLERWQFDVCACLNFQFYETKC